MVYQLEKKERIGIPNGPHLQRGAAAQGDHSQGGGGAYQKRHDRGLQRLYGHRLSQGASELARRAEEGEELGITVITGGNVGDQLDGVLARSGVMKRRYGFQGNRDLRALANADRIQYVDTHVSHGPYLIKNGYLGKIDAPTGRPPGGPPSGPTAVWCSPSRWALTTPW